MAILANIAASSTSVPAVGILANYNQGDIINTFATGQVKNTNIDIAGGLVGDNSGLIAQSYVYSNIAVYATNIAGGLVGYNEKTGTILDSWASYGMVRSVADSTGVTYVGGLVGVNDGTIKTSYASDRLDLLDPNSLAGSFVGKNTGTIDQSYAAPSGAYDPYNIGPNLAGFVYDNSGTITNSYTTSLSNINAFQTTDLSGELDRRLCLPEFGHHRECLRGDIFSQRQGCAAIRLCAK